METCRKIKLEEIPEIEIENSNENQTGCPVPCEDAGKYLRCYHGLHYLCPKLLESYDRFKMRKIEE